MLLWTAYPLTVLMEEIWRRHLHPILDKRASLEAQSGWNPRSRRTPSINHLATVPPPQWLELLAIVERSLCFAHTGSAPSLAYALMKRTFTSRALLDGFLPMFWDGLEISDAAPLNPTLHFHKWPLNNNKEPLLASKRSQLLTYGRSHLAVNTSFDHLFPSMLIPLSQGYTACFNIQLRLSRLLVRVGPSSGTAQVDIALKVLAEVIIDAFIQDITDLVRKALSALKDSAQLHPERYDTDWINVRWDSFCQWEAATDRLDYGVESETFVLLARALTKNEDDPIRGLPASNLKSISVGDLARSIHDICLRAETRQQIRAPVWRDGNLAAVARVAIANAHNRIGRSASDQEKGDQIIKFLTKALSTRNVRFFPDTPPGGGPNPSIDAWTYLGNRPNAKDIANNRLETIGARRTRLWEEQGRIASLADVNSHWSILDCTIESFATYISHACLPEEWDYKREKSITGNSQILPVYEWAAERLSNPNADWRTRLAVALAFLITKLTPNHVFCPDSSKGNEYPILTSVSTYLGQLVPATRHHSITILRQLPWISKPNRGGTIDRSLYFTQASVVILAWIDPASPIRKDLALRAAKNTRISIFNTKHSTSGHLSFTRSDVHVW